MEQSWLLQVGLKVNEDSWGTDAIATIERVRIERIRTK